MWARRIFRACAAVSACLWFSTPEGVMTGNTARKKNLGGEVLCYIW